MITIVAVLAALVSVAVVRAVDTAKQTRIKTEIDQLHAAFETFKQKYGAYPPCDLRVSLTAASPADPYYNAPLRRQLARMFPKYDQTYLVGQLMGAGVNVRDFRPDQALVFWLKGFNRNPQRPLDRGDKAQCTPDLFEFDKGRLDTSYYPPGSGDMPPYVYLDAASYGAAPDIATSTPAKPNTFNSAIPTPTTRSSTGMDSVPPFVASGAVVSYWLDANGNGTTHTPSDAGEGWVNADSFQIIAAGQDARYGKLDSSYAMLPSVALPKLYKTGTGYDEADEDNVTNFCPRPRLGDDRP